MGSESNMRRKVLEILKPLDARPCENPADPGTPDIHHIHGWLELKQIDDWPVRESTVVSVPHFRPEQKLWLRRRDQICLATGIGRCDLLLRVGRAWLLLTGTAAVASLGCLPRASLVTVALRYWPAGLPAGELLSICSTPRI